jgi:hypothetical protein
MIVAAENLSLPARAPGATRDHVTNSAVVSVLAFCAFVFFVAASLCYAPTAKKNGAYLRRHPTTSGVLLTSKPISGGSKWVTPERCSTRRRSSS